MYLKMEQEQKQERWTIEQTEKFIDIFEDYPNLYDAKDNNYNNRNVRQDTLYEIVEAMKKYRKCVTPEDLKGKIRGLRTQYMKEKHEVEKWRKRSDGKGDMYEPKLWCYDRLSFLDNHTNKRPKRSDIAEKTEAKFHSTSDDEQNESKVEITEFKIEPKYKKELWTVEQTEKFIEAFEEFPNLYDVNDANYHDRNLREDTLDEIVKTMKEYRKCVTPADLKSKIRGLRTQFMKEKREIEKSRKRASGPEDLYVPKLWCFNRLSFLDNDSNERLERSNTFEEEDVKFFSPSDNGQDDESYVEIPEPRKKKRTYEIQEEPEESTESALILALKLLSKERKESREDYFSKFISKELSNITDEEILTETKLKIYQAIAEGITKNVRKELAEEIY